jgi:molybdopterin molybdotransferase
MIAVGEADRVLAERCTLLPMCACPLIAAHGRILREDIRADRDQPPYDRVTMDGIAVSSTAVAAGIRVFRMLGVQAAGQPPLSSSEPQACIGVMTGAVLPAGYDAVVRIEDVEVTGDLATLGQGVAVRPGQNVHPRGSDGTSGQIVVAKGVRLSPPQIGIAAATGMSALRVSARPAIAVLSTGDELVEVGGKVEDHQIRRSNGYAIQAALASRGHDGAAVCNLPDDKPALSSALAQLLERFDLLVLTGGVSMGRFDFVPEVLTELGVENHIHKVRQRPGKPFWFGSRAGKNVFALPGNPVSALTCLYRYVLPFLDRAAGLVDQSLPRVRLAGEARGVPGLTRFLPVSINEGSGEGLASPVEINTSGDFLALGRSDGFVEIAESALVPAGSVLPFYAWSPS